MNLFIYWVALFFSLHESVPVEQESWFKKIVQEETHKTTKYEYTVL